MPDYSKGKIYSIRSYLTTDVYYGSTIETLARRLIQHKRDYKIWLNKKEKSNLSSFRIIEKDSDCYIELVEDYPCNNRNELHKREGEIIRANTCVNKRIAGRTYNEWLNDNKEQILEYKKQYYQNNKEILAEHNKHCYENNKEQIAEHNKQYRTLNKEKIAEKAKVKYTCNCGAIANICNKLRHEKSIKHQTFINSTQ